MMTDVEHGRNVEKATRTPEPVRPNFVGIAFLIAMIVVGVVYVVAAISYGISAETNPMGPGAAPAALGILLIVCCLVLLGQEYRSQRKATAAAQEGLASAEPPPQGARDLVKPLLILVFLLAGLMLAQVVGMLIAMPLAVIGIALFVERIKPIQALLMGTITALMLWLVFQQLLSIRFPNSLIGL